jgi:uncharacterized protein with FMN-binding domain
MWWILFALLVLIAVGLVMAMRVDGPNRKEASQLQFENVQFSNLKDGTYVGSGEVAPRTFATPNVEVQIAGGQVSSFRISRVLFPRMVSRSSFPREGPLMSCFRQPSKQKRLM